jgi:hypothetical protein
MKERKEECLAKVCTALCVAPGDQLSSQPVRLAAFSLFAAGGVLHPNL